MKQVKETEIEIPVVKSQIIRTNSLKFIVDTFFTIGTNNMSIEIKTKRGEIRINLERSDLEALVEIVEEDGGEQEWNDYFDYDESILNPLKKLLKEEDYKYLNFIIE